MLSQLVFICCFVFLHRDDERANIARRLVRDWNKAGTFSADFNRLI